MKNIILIIGAFLLISNAAFSQKVAEAKVPAEVKTAFKAKFPTATKVGYEMEKNNYEISFMKDGTECSANFDKTGKWLETEIELTNAQIPVTVKATLDKEFAGYKINESVILETPGAAKLYEFEVSKGSSKFEVQIAADGKLVKKEPIGKESEEND